MKKDLNNLGVLVKRNMKVYFSDKTIFFTSLMAPLILLLLYILFLRNVYYDSFVSTIIGNFNINKEKIGNAFVASWILGSIVAVSGFTVPLGSGMIMVQDKLSGSINDFKSSPIKDKTIALSYFLSTLIQSFLIIIIVLVLGFIYIGINGWYLSFVDFLLVLLNAFLLTMFASIISTIIGYFIKSEGGITAVSALSSSVYGFICGAYMPLSQFGSTFSNIFGFNPGLYSSIIFKKRLTKGLLKELDVLGSEWNKGVSDAFDINFYFFSKNVSELSMWIILSIAVLGLLLLLVVLNRKKVNK